MFSIGRCQCSLSLYATMLSAHPLLTVPAGVVDPVRLLPGEAVAVGPVEGGPEPAEVARHSVVGAAGEEFFRRHAGGCGMKGNK